MTLSVQLWARPPLVPLECGEEHRWSGFRVSKAFSGLELKKSNYAPAGALGTDARGNKSAVTQKE